MKLLELLFCEFVSPYDNEYYEKLQSKAIQQYVRERERERAKKRERGDGQTRTEISYGHRYINK